MTKRDKQIKLLWRQGKPVRFIALTYGVTQYYIHKLCIPGFMEKERERGALKREKYRLKKMDGVNRHVTSQQLRRDAAERMAEIPEDTRDLTAMLLGDPLPGRSALDKKRALEASA